MGTEAETLELANMLRKYGINVDIDMTGQKIKKAYSYADKIGIPFASVIGETEINSKTFTIKSLVTGQQRNFTFNNYNSIVTFIQG
jgi:histidyl-tRNA synthetase